MVSKQSGGGSRKVCKTCGGDEVLVSTDFVNGREVDVSEPCPDCCDEDGCNDTEVEARTIDRDQRDFDDMRADQHERYLRAFGPSFFEGL